MFYCFINCEVYKCERFFMHINGLNYNRYNNYYVSNVRYRATDNNTSMVSNPQNNSSVNFKGDVNRQDLFLRVAQAAMLGDSAAFVKLIETLSPKEQEIVMKAINEQMGFIANDDNSNIEETNNLSVEEQAAEDFKNMDSFYWTKKYSQTPEFEKLLLEKDTYKDKSGKRLYFVRQSDVIHVFRNDIYALGRIYTRENVLDIEKLDDRRNSAIEDLSKTNGNIAFLDNLMHEKDSEGKTMLHLLAYQSVNALEHVNNAYAKRLDVLADMYLSKDNNNKYPLDYIKDKPAQIQKEMLNLVNSTFEYKPELLINILEASHFDKEAEFVKKIQEIKKNGYEHIEEETGNRIVEHIDSRWQIEAILNGKKRYGLADEYEKYNPKGLLIEKQESICGSTWKTIYKYDEKNRLIERTIEAAHGTETICYEYDNDGNQKVVKDDSKTGWSQW